MAARIFDIKVSVNVTGTDGTGLTEEDIKRMILDNLMPHPDRQWPLSPLRSVRWSALATEINERK